MVLSDQWFRSQWERLQNRFFFRVAALCALKVQDLHHIHNKLPVHQAKTHTW